MGRGGKINSELNPAFKLKQWYMQRGAKEAGASYYAKRYLW